MSFIPPGRLMVDMQATKNLLILLLLAVFSHPVWAQEAADETVKTVQSPSPDGRFAFLLTATSELKTFDLIAKKSRKVLRHVAESDPDFGNRFEAEVLWRPDSKAFALTTMVVRLGSSVAVFHRKGAAFREDKVPELVVDVPEKLTRGRQLDHFAAVSSQSAKHWQKDGSLVVEITTTVDSNGTSATATRTVVLGFDRSGKTKILKSTIKSKLESD
jgi:hypothetical protein